MPLEVLAVEWYYYTVPVVLFVAYFLGAHSLKDVLTLDSFMTFIVDILIIVFTKDILTWIINPETDTDALHELLFIQVALMTLVPALVWIIITDSYDVTVPHALAFSKAVGFGLAAVVTLCFQEISSNLEFIALTLSLSLLYLFHLYHHNEVNSVTRYGNLNHYLRLDLYLAVVWAALCLCLPGIVLLPRTGEVNDAHIHLCRVHGALTLGHACLLLIAPSFSSATSKRALLCSRALVMLAILFLTLFGFLQEIISDGLATYLLMLFLLVLTLPSAVGCLSQDQTIGWELPWHGLHRPGIPVSVARVEDSKKSRRSPKRRRSRRRLSPRRSPSRSRSQSRRGRRRHTSRRRKSRTHISVPELVHM